MFTCLHSEKIKMAIFADDVRVLRNLKKSADVIRFRHQYGNIFYPIVYKMFSTTCVQMLTVKSPSYGCIIAI